MKIRYILLLILCSCSLLDKWVTPDQNDKPAAVQTEVTEKDSQEEMTEVSEESETTDTEKIVKTLEQRDKHPSITPQINRYCHELDQKFYSYRWEESHW